MLSTTEKIKVLLQRQKMTAGELAERTGQTRQNLSNKFKRDNFAEKYLHDIAAALGCTCEVVFTTASGEKI